jgi:hypothetical protein
LIRNLKNFYQHDFNGKINLLIDINKRVESRTLLGGYVTANGFQLAMINVGVPLLYAFAQCEGVTSVVDDLSLGQGVVLSRVASTLRSIET